FRRVLFRSRVQYCEPLYRHDKPGTETKILRSTEQKRALMVCNRWMRVEVRGPEKEQATLGRRDFSNTRGSCGHCNRLHGRGILFGLYASGPATPGGHAHSAGEDYFFLC